MRSDSRSMHRNSIYPDDRHAMSFHPAKAEAKALGEAHNVSRFPTRTTPRPIKAREMTSETKTADDGRGRRRRHHHHRCNRPPFYESEISASFCVPLEAAAEGGRGRCGFVQGFVRVKRRWCHDALRRFLPFFLPSFLPCLFSSALTSLILKGRMNNGRTDASAAAAAEAVEQNRGEQKVR